MTALIRETEGDAQSEAADTMLQTLHGWPDTPRPMSDPLPPPTVQQELSSANAEIEDLQSRAE